MVYFMTFLEASRKIHFNSFRYGHFWPFRHFRVNFLRFASCDKLQRRNGVRRPPSFHFYPNLVSPGHGVHDNLGTLVYIAYHLRRYFGNDLMSWLWCCTHFIPRSPSCCLFFQLHILCRLLFVFCKSFFFLLKEDSPSCNSGDSLVALVFTCSLF